MQARRHLLQTSLSLSVRTHDESETLDYSVELQRASGLINISVRILLQSTRVGNLINLNYVDRELLDRMINVVKTREVTIMTSYIYL